MSVFLAPTRSCAQDFTHAVGDCAPTGTGYDCFSALWGTCDCKCANVISLRKRCAL